MNKIVGVMGYQGGFDAHLDCLKDLGIASRKILKPEDFNGLTGLILPGGESSVQYLYCQKQEGVSKGIIDFARSGGVILGTCAGAILLSNYVSDKVKAFGLLDINVERNAYGRQIDSGFKESDNKNEVLFIRAPVISEVGKNVEIIDTYQNKPILVKQGNIYGATYHPELMSPTKENLLYQLFS